MKAMASFGGVAALTAATLAQPVVPARLAPGALGTYFAPNYLTPEATRGAWFVFTMSSAGPVDIDINRTTAPPDLFGALFAGDVTGVDVAAELAGSNVRDRVIIGNGVIGPLTRVETRDDTEDDPFGGPFGDPRFTRTLNAGTYSLYVTSLQPAVGGAFTMVASGMSGAVVATSLTGGVQGRFFAAEDDGNPASVGSWFTFTLGQRANVELDVTRAVAAVDPAMTLFRGDVRGVNASAISPDGLIDGLFQQAGTFGPLTIIGFANDTDDDPFGGPFSDPRIRIDRLAPGTYSALVGANGPLSGGTFEIDSFRIRPTPLVDGTQGVFFAGNGPLAGTSWFTFTLPRSGPIDLTVRRVDINARIVAVLMSGDATGLATQITDRLGLSTLGDGYGPLITVAVDAGAVDDGRGGAHSDPRLARVLPAGTYSVLVAGFTPSESDFSTITVFGCGPADVAEAAGVLDVNDLLVFAEAFNQGDETADLAEAFGVFDINDILAFAQVFNAGCP